VLVWCAWLFDEFGEVENGFGFIVCELEVLRFVVDGCLNG